MQSDAMIVSLERLLTPFKGTRGLTKQSPPASYFFGNLYVCHASVLFWVFFTQNELCNLFINTK